MNLCQPLKIEEVKENEENDDQAQGLMIDHLKSRANNVRYLSRLANQLVDPIDQQSAKNSGIKLFNEAEWDEIQLGHDGVAHDLDSSVLNRLPSSKSKVIKNAAMIK